MKILTAEEMNLVDRRSVEAGVSVEALMQNAGSAVSRFCLRHFADDGLVVVLCGKGNNGGDGMVAAVRLSEAGRAVRVVLLGASDEVKGDAAAVLERAKSQAGVEVCEVSEEEGLRAAMVGAALVVDAVVGTGFKPPLRGLTAVVKGLLDVATMPVVAVDLPSGWDADSTAQKSETAFRADAVVTFVAPKMAHVFGSLTTATFGSVVVADIGTPASALDVGFETGESGVEAEGDAVAEAPIRMHWAGAAKSIAETPRDINGNKGKFGHVLIVGGALGKAGAPSMASLAAMRAGAGLVTVAVPREIVPTVAAVAAELMLTPLAVGEDGGLAMEVLTEHTLEALLKGISVIGIGPGLGQVGTTPEFVRKFVERTNLPIVIDADALNAFAGQTWLLKDAAKQAQAKMGRRTMVLTPHPGEMARLLGISVKDVEADRVGLARRFAVEHGVTLVLKGWRTLIAHPDGRVAVNTTGNPAMAKGGSGDVLTGIVAAMLAQYGNDVAAAVEAAVFLHGLAGDFATLAQDEHTVLATDTVEHLWEAFRSRVVDEDGLTWIAGTAAKGRFVG